MLSENLARLNMSVVISLICCFLIANGNALEKKYDEEEGKEYLKQINNDIQVKTTESVVASWAYESNITDENLRNQLEVSAKLANFTKKIWEETIKYPWETFKDPDTRRQFQKFSVLGTAILSPSKYEKFNKIVSDMQSVYGKAKVCNYHNRTDCSLQLEPELTEIFVKSRDPDELRYYWEQWRNVAGKPVRKMFKEYVDLSNEAAVLNNFTDSTEFWLKDYEAKDFKEQVEGLWEQLRPLYLQLHAFVRRRLREQYGEEHVTKKGPIPAHLLGNMWAQSWGNIFNFVTPYPNKPSMDVTPNMVEQGYTPLRMFKLAEEFFTSLNLSPMPETFWKNSILEKPTDGRDLICHASAWDFYDGKDFRIKQCTRVTFRQLVTVHHEMGHIQYYLQYKNQPKIFKRGANPGFHEAVGDVMALSVSTPKHLRKIGLLNDTQDDAESEINQLFSMALDKIAFLPFGYLMDQWRWSVFEDKTTEKDYNCKWWQLREKYQGLSPSVLRTEEDFDPGAKYHTVGNVPYIRYFVSFVIQFQFHRSLCIAANEFRPDDPTSKPLHKCDIYQSKEAGALLKKMLQMGSSKPWPDAMEVITGQRNMDARALLDYFATLQTWLENENKRTGEFIGWEPSQKACMWKETETEEKISKAQGNFEDDNIAYSYAEFVRQDDNSFGFPDYIEETQPFYHTLGCRLKQRKTQENFFHPKRNILKFSKTNNLHPSKRSYLKPEEKNNIIDIFKLQRGIEKQFAKYNRKYWTPGVQVNADSEKRTNKGEAKKSESEDTIPIGLRKSSKQTIDNNISPSLWTSNGITGKDIKNFEKRPNNQIMGGLMQISILKDNDDLNLKNSRGFTQNLDMKPEKHQSPVIVLRNKNDEQNALGKSNENEQKAIQYSSNSNVSKNDNPVANSYPILNLAKKMSSVKLELEGSKDLLSKSEKVKNGAQELLKIFKVTDANDNDNLHTNNRNPIRWFLPYVTLPVHQTSKKTEVSTPLKVSEYFTRGNSIQVDLQPINDLPKTLGVTDFKNNAQIRKKTHNNNFDLLGIVPASNSPLRNNKNSNDEKLRINMNGKNDFNFIVLGKRSKNHLKDVSFRKNIEKKSYKEYHCPRKGSGPYNEVVINGSAKADKSIYLINKRLKINGLTSLPEHKKNMKITVKRKNVRDLIRRQKERSRREFFNDKFYNSVKNNKYNIKNIVHYFGCLQLLM